MNNMKDILSAFDSAGVKKTSPKSEKSMKQLLESLDKINESASMNISMSGETPTDIKDMLSSLYGNESASMTKYEPSVDDTASYNTSSYSSLDAIPGNGMNTNDDVENSTLSSDDIVYKTDEEYNNEPEEEYQDISDIIKKGDDLNREKGSYAKAEPGDNPRAVNRAENKLKEELSRSLKQHMKESFKKKSKGSKKKS